MWNVKAGLAPCGLFWAEALIRVLRARPSRGTIPILNATFVVSMSNGALVQGQAIEAIPVAERLAPEARHLQLVVPRLNRHENAGVYAIAAVRWNAIFRKRQCVHRIRQHTKS